MYVCVCVDIMGCLPPDLFVCARERGVCGVRRRERGDDVVRTRYHKNKTPTYILITCAPLP